jgi:hypothetical protein
MSTSTGERIENEGAEMQLAGKPVSENEGSKVLLGLYNLKEKIV